MKKKETVKVYKKNWNHNSLSYKLQELKDCRNTLKAIGFNLALCPILTISFAYDLIANPDVATKSNFIGLGISALLTIASIKQCRVNIKQLKELKEDIVNLLKKYEPEQFENDEDSKQLLKRI